MHWSIKIIISILLISIVTSCTLIPYIVLFNNTSEKIIVTYSGKKYLLEPYSLKEIMAVGEILEIETSKTSWFYKVAYFPQSFIKHEFTKDLINIQLQSNGWIYILYPTNNLPAKTFPMQPEGYPLKPKGKK